MLKRQLERYGKWLLAIGALAVLALVVTGYILSQQNLTFPWQDRYMVRAEFSATSGVGKLGQPVNVAGVEVGKILGSELDDGRSVVKLEIDPAKLPSVYRDAHATLVPRTPLKDLQVEIAPGTRSAGELPDGGLIPVARTTPPVDSDELTAALDKDTRDFFQVLVGDLTLGVANRGRDMRELFKALGPTSEQVKRVAGVLAARDDELRRLVHNLSVFTTSAGTKDRELASLVTDANQTVGALAEEESALGESVDKLPATLADARSSLITATSFADELGPALRALMPTADRLPSTLRAVAPLVRRSGPTIRTRIRPFARAAQPLVRDLRAATPELKALTPDLISAFRVLTYTVNELANNPPGSDEGYLYWLAWFAHNGNSLVSTQDANGSMIRGLLLLDCDTLASQPALAPLLKLLVPIEPSCD